MLPVDRSVRLAQIPRTDLFGPLELVAPRPDCCDFEDDIGRWIPGSPPADPVEPRPELVGKRPPVPDHECVGRVRFQRCPELLRGDQLRITVGNHATGKRLVRSGHDLAALARFYPLSGVPGPVVNDLVRELEKLRLDTFQELVARALLFYEAQCKGWEA